MVTDDSNYLMLDDSNYSMQYERLGEIMENYNR